MSPLAHWRRLRRPIDPDLDRAIWLTMRGAAFPFGAVHVLAFVLIRFY